jgi:hypothetical protein
VKIVLDLVDADAEARIVDRHARPGSGCVVADVAGERGAIALTRAVAAGLGKRANRTGGGARAYAASECATAWLLADQPEHLIVRRAQFLDRYGWDAAVALARLCQVQLWLVVDGTALRRWQLQLAQHHSIEIIDYDAFQTIFAATADAVAAAAATAPLVLPELPRTHFLNFPPLHALDDAERALVGVAFAETKQCLHARIEREGSARHAESALALVRDVLQEAASADDALVRFRAAQQILFLRGWLLHADDTDVVNASGATGWSRLDQATCVALRSYLRTSFAAAAVLRIAARRSPDVLVAINICDVADDGSRVSIGETSIDIPADAHAILRAHLIVRRTEGAVASDPFFAPIPKNPHERPVGRLSAGGMRHLLKTVADELRIPLLGKLASGGTRAETPQAWARRAKIRLVVLDAPLAAATLRRSRSNA